MSTRKAIFVTGGASGIGRAIALYFAERDWFVGVGDVDEAGMRETLGMMKHGFSYRHTFDVRKLDQWEEALDAFATAAGGRIDVVVNNAGIAPGGPIDTLSAEEISACIDINVTGVIFGAKAAHPHLARTAPGSCLLNTASIAGLYGLADISVYCASKAAVRSLTEAFDAEWSEEGIKVASLCPIFVDTPLLDKTPNRSSNDIIRDNVTEQKGEVLPVADVAAAAWRAVHSDELHHLLGKTTKKLAFARRWMPGRLRRMVRRGESAWK
ncbi:SDR family oxidoreductase [Qipengyuania sphaerica]|uniref:SDR family oxidoreductase n=1 Tax=Qipengyuania sphaerica TaxID=2867243 RepID=UPI001C869823|nr:SDR family oxidoreductase [Qipengyuania sphaerica]MBX7540011.1 SDR family oxidoreductase [Qipengyuania sphaerica]